jgi:hypothetical protein
MLSDSVIMLSVIKMIAASLSVILQRINLLSVILLCIIMERH